MTGPTVVLGVGEALAACVHLAAGSRDWEPAPVDGLEVQDLYRNAGTGASASLLRFAAGTGIGGQHRHASNQFMYCIEGEYLDEGSGARLRPGDFLCNPKDVLHGPTRAVVETVLLEIYDGPHYYDEEGPA